MTDTKDSITYRMIMLSNIIDSNLNEIYKKYDLNVALSIVMFIVFDNPSITQIELCERKKMDRTTGGKLVDKLEEMELLQRVQSPKDRRAYNLYLTDKGKELVNVIWNERKTFEDKVLDVLEEDEKNVFLKSLEKIFELSMQEENMKNSERG